MWLYLAQLQGVLPNTASGWVSLVVSTIGLGAIIFGWGRWTAKMEAVEKTVADFKTSVHNDFEVLNRALKDYQDDCRIQAGRLTVAEHVLWGPKGDNGLSHDIKDLLIEVRQIRLRNDRIDAVEERRRQEQRERGEYPGPERRRRADEEGR